MRTFIAFLVGAFVSGFLSLASLLFAVATSGPPESDTKIDRLHRVEQQILQNSRQLKAWTHTGRDLARERQDLKDQRENLAPAARAEENQLDDVAEFVLE